MRLLNRINTLAKFGASNRGGVTRYCWSEEYEQARRWLLQSISDAGLTGWVDSAGNIFGGLNTSKFDSNTPVVLTGSHIDTVENGGTLDGVLGVLAGLECLHQLRESGIKLRRPVVVAAWSDEEGRYGSLFGSRAFAGLLDAARIPIMASVTGEKLVDVMHRAGFDALQSPAAQAPPGSVASYVELHIEQGPVLEHLQMDIGVVEAIVGIRRVKFQFLGQADHAGTTPMPLRKDAFMAAADFAVQARHRIDTYTQSTAKRLVTNFGVCQVHPGYPTVVPERVELIQEMRDTSAEVLQAVGEEMQQLALKVAAQWKCEVQSVLMNVSTPALCAPLVQDAIRFACAEVTQTRRNAVKVHQMHSGAGHDAQNIAQIAPAGMIFIPSVGGRSHRPDESSTVEQIELGAEVLLKTLVQLANA
eukprot:TRINITY_DN2606_c0_g1_i1.p1 TRINITY_DN2606_c0_g1~~TRINITY_DN2606_c0_g1_i1.p1  ORF type:complete len:417 (-),score=109.30 TRINITY_DN2606_c0_g1_i1:1891-3141(-)